MKKILIIGATSMIAQRCAAIWAQQGATLFLVGRNPSKLSHLSSDLLQHGATDIFSFTMDINCIDQHLKMLSAADHQLAGIDIVLIAHGSLPDQKYCEINIEQTVREINTNAISTIALLTLIANYFETRRRGTIAVISSVAGERGRASNYVYGSAKAMVTTFCSGLRQRLHKSKVNVLTVKPGFVDTPMTHHLPKNILWSSPDKIAQKITNAIEKKADEIYTPRYWSAIMFLIKIIPSKLFKKINL